MERIGKRPTVISLFSGGGGLDLGLAMAGFETRAAVEIERYACATLRANQAKRIEVAPGHTYLDGCEIIEDSVRDVTSERLMDAARLAPEEATLLAGGPPCITFSVAGRRQGLAVETGLLFEEYVRVLHDLKPAGLVYENVKGLLTAQDEHGVRGGAFQRIYAALAGEGYALSWRVVNTADYGVPQFRERVIILGLRGDTAPAFPEPAHYDPERRERAISTREPWHDVRWALRGLPRAADPGTEPEVPNHVSRRHGPEVVAAFEATPQGKRNPQYKRDRLRWDRPAKVIRAQGKPKPDGSGQKNSSHQSIHPEEHRQLTVRECARIQTFPDWYELPMTLVNGYRIVGDAVPPELGRVLGEAMLDALEPSKTPAMENAA